MGGETSPTLKEMNHPLKPGQKIVSREGEIGDTELSDDVNTGPNAVGTVVIFHERSPGKFVYYVEFYPGIGVFLNNKELDSEKYELYTEESSNV